MTGSISRCVLALVASRVCVPPRPASSPVFFVALDGRPPLPCCCCTFGAQGRFWSRDSELDPPEAAVDVRRTTGIRVSENAPEGIGYVSADEDDDCLSARDVPESLAEEAAAACRRYVGDIPPCISARVSMKRTINPSCSTCPRPLPDHVSPGRSKVTHVADTACTRVAWRHICASDRRSSARSKSR